MLPRPFGDEEPDEEPVGRATLKRQSQDILNQAVERRELVGEGGATAPGNRIHRGMENSGTNQRRDPMYACSPAGSFPPSLPPPSCSGQPALVGGPPMMWRGMTPDTRGGGGHGGGGGGHGGGGGYGGSGLQPPPPPPPEMVLRRKGGWSDGPKSQSFPRQHAHRENQRPEAQNKKPEQIAATKAGFVSGRNVWGGTTERRESAGQAAARAKAAIAAARAATGDSRTGS